MKIKSFLKNLIVNIDIKSLLKKLIVKWKQVLTAIVLIYIAYLLIDIIFFENDKGQTKKPTEMQVGSIKLQGYSAGKKQWEFTAKEVEYLENNRVLAKKNSKGVIYKDDKPFLEINASKVDFDMQSKNFTASGGVIIRVIGQDQEFQADMLSWNANEEKCEANSKVVARFKDNILSADSFIYYVKNQKFEMRKGVKLELDVEVH